MANRCNVLLHTPLTQLLRSATSLADLSSVYKYCSMPLIAAQWRLADTLRRSPLYDVKKIHYMHMPLGNTVAVPTTVSCKNTRSRCRTLAEYAVVEKHWACTRKEFSWVLIRLYAWL